MPEPIGTIAKAEIFRSLQITAIETCDLFKRDHGKIVVQVGMHRLGNDQEFLVIPFEFCRPKRFSRTAMPFD